MGCGEEKRDPGEQNRVGGGAFNLSTRITGPASCSTASGPIRKARTPAQGWAPYRLLHDSRPISKRIATAAVVPRRAFGACAIGAARCSFRTAPPRRPGLLKPRQVANHHWQAATQAELACTKITIRCGAQVAFHRLTSCLKRSTITTPRPPPRNAQAHYCSASNDNLPY
jgi:hypothetical protein